MQTNFSPNQLRDPQIAASEAVIRKCVHCGFCTATCPTYVLLGDELDSPRGRIYLMKEMLEKEQAPTTEVVTHIDRCLSCLSCMTICPSGVNYMHLVDHARAYIEARYERPLHERLVRELIARILPYPRRTRVALRLARAARWLEPAFARAKATGALAAMLRLAPDRVPAPEPVRNAPTTTSRRGRVVLLQGCVEPVLRPEIRAATVRLLTRAAFDVDFAAESSPTKNAREQKAVNDAVAYIRALAEMRGRNAAWAEKAVREAASLSANAALEQHVIDIVAKDTASLLAQVDGRRILIDGRDRTIDTTDLVLARVAPDWTSRFLGVITDPNVALILMMVGIYGLFFEFMNPGSFVPGTIGAVSLLMGLYALAVLPVDFVGVALILLGVALMLGEAFAPSFGILGMGGLAAFVLGSALLFDTNIPAFQVDWSVMAALAAFSVGLLIAVARLGVRSQRGRVETGLQEMIGARGKVLDWNDGAGHVFVHSERWNAVGPRSLSQGEVIAVEGVSGLTLEVSPLEIQESRPPGE